jgi:hypothetical protein
MQAALVDLKIQTAMATPDLTFTMPIRIGALR